MDTDKNKNPRRSTSYLGTIQATNVMIAPPHRQAQSNKKKKN